MMVLKQKYESKWYQGRRRNLAAVLILVIGLSRIYIQVAEGFADSHTRGMELVRILVGVAVISFILCVLTWWIADIYIARRMRIRVHEMHPGRELIFVRMGLKSYAQAKEIAGGQTAFSPALHQSLSFSFAEDSIEFHSWHHSDSLVLFQIPYAEITSVQVAKRVETRHWHGAGITIECRGLPFEIRLKEETLFGVFGMRLRSVEVVHELIAEAVLRSNGES